MMSYVDSVPSPNQSEDFILSTRVLCFGPIVEKDEAQNGANVGQEQRHYQILSFQMRGLACRSAPAIIKIAMKFVPSDRNATENESAMSAATPVMRGMTLKDSRDAVPIPRHAVSKLKYENQARMSFLGDMGQAG